MAGPVAKRRHRGDRPGLGRASRSPLEEAGWQRVQLADRLRGVVYLHTAVDGQDAEAVIAFDAATGDEKWRDEYPRAPYRSELGVGPRGTPGIFNGGLYTIGITGVLSCYDIATGQRRWQMNPYDELKAPLPGFGVCISPIVADDKVILPVGGEGSAVVAIEALTGKIAWTRLDEPAATASPVVLKRGDAAAPRTEVVVQSTLRLMGLAPADGTILWEHPLVFQPQGVSPTPLSIGDFLVCSTQDTGTMTLELPTGSQEQPHQKWWKQDLSSYFSTGTIDTKGRVFLISNQLMPLPRADVHCIDLATGDEKWVKTGLGYFHVATTLTGDGRMLVLDDAGGLTLAEVGDDGFQSLCKAKVCGGTFCNPALANGRLYVRDAKELVCLKVGAASP